jgi:hypothetical protein
MNTPKTDAAFEAAKTAAEYCYGKPLGVQGWRDIACAMRDDARKYESIAAELEARVEDLTARDNLSESIASERACDSADPSS